MDEELRQVYWDTVKNQFYWISWFDTGNGEIPTRHYIQVVVQNLVK